MDLNRRAEIVAFARLLGIQGTDKEIFENFWNYYQNALKSLSANQNVAKATTFKSPF